MTRKAPLGLSSLTLALVLGCSSSSTNSDDEVAGGGTSGAGGTSSGGTSSGGKGGASGGGGTGANAGSGSAGSAGSVGGNVSGGGGGAGGSAGTYACDTEFSNFDKSCDSAADCVLVDHTTSCCGDTLRMAINEEEQERFATVEAYCSAQFPACGCAAQGVSAEDGSLVQYGSEGSIVAACTDGLCQSRYDGTTFACANRVCTEQQFCTIIIGGPSGSEPSGSCSPEAECGDCSCHDVVGCQCVEQDGHVTVTCAAP